MKIHETGMPSPVEIHKSSECGKEYRSSPALDKHEKSHFGNTKILKCDLSDKIHSGKAHLKQHIHTREKRYECEICQKQYNYKSALVTHMKIHITGITSPIEIHKCSECGKEYRTSSALGKHKKTHFGNAKIYKCDLCGTTFAESSRLEQHYLIHTGEKPSQCEICMK
ncbi:Zinc finger protein 98 [Araneus ventricosus]|uniref:Zinc finger protein 98 n=1 Tax=Araneus ventricosus TaxID=182803 RepID=A0A4Y2GE62_ARAVE|nr:Zinc finger protein 98 [Araneus ventricosus]